MESQESVGHDYPYQGVYLCCNSSYTDWRRLEYSGPADNVVNSGVEEPGKQKPCKQYYKTPYNMANVGEGSIWPGLRWSQLSYFHMR